MCVCVCVCVCVRPCYIIPTRMSLSALEHLEAVALKKYSLRVTSPCIAPECMLCASKLRELKPIVNCNIVSVSSGSLKDHLKH